MFKLLTEEYTEQLVHEYSMRRTVVMLGALIFTLVVGIGGLLPSYILSNARKNEVVARKNALDQINVGADSLDLEDWLANTNSKLTLLAPKLDTDRPTELINQVVSEKIPGIHITSLSWVKAKKSNKISVTITGTADTRQAIVDFENKMSTSKNFIGVAFPISDLARDRDINFQMQLSPAASGSQSKETS